MAEQKNQQLRRAMKQASQADNAGSKSYLNHGVPSMVGMDSPDDSQLGAPQTSAAETEE